jgi:FKBP-type peptidyl-prolyl cis-trans isomerase
MLKNRRTTILMLLSAVLLISLWSCNPSSKYEKEEAQEIEDYLNNNSNLDFILQPSGLYYLEVEEGFGLQPATSDTAYIKYTGKFLNGTVFDSNVQLPDSLIVPVNEGWLISGFDEGITLMKEGGKAIFLVPSKLAYGASGYYTIQGYTPLLFDVELAKITPGPGK